MTARYSIFETQRCWRDRIKECHLHATSGVIPLVITFAFPCGQAENRVSLVCHFVCHFAFAHNRMQTLAGACVRILA